MCCHPLRGGDCGFDTASRRFVFCNMCWLRTFFHVANAWDHGGDGGDGGGGKVADFARLADRIGPNVVDRLGLAHAWIPDPPVSASASSTSKKKKDTKKEKRENGDGNGGGENNNHNNDAYNGVNGVEGAEDEEEVTVAAASPKKVADYVRDYIVSVCLKAAGEHVFGGAEPPPLGDEGLFVKWCFRQPFHFDQLNPSAQELYAEAATAAAADFGPRHRRESGRRETTTTRPAARVEHSPIDAAASAWSPLAHAMAQAPSSLSLSSSSSSSSPPQQRSVASVPSPGLYPRYYHPTPLPAGFFARMDAVDPGPPLPAAAAPPSPTATDAATAGEGGGGGAGPAAYMDVASPEYAEAAKKLLQAQGLI